MQRPRDKRQCGMFELLKEFLRSEHTECQVRAKKAKVGKYELVYGVKLSKRV